MIESLSQPDWQVVLASPEKQLKLSEVRVSEVTDTMSDEQSSTVSDDALEDRHETQTKATPTSYSTESFTKGDSIHILKRPSQPLPTPLDKVREIVRLSLTRARVYIEERHDKYKPMSEKGQFTHNYVEPLFYWWGKNKRVLTTQCRSSVKIQEPNGLASKVVNGASHNYAGFYKATPQSEELQRLCLDKLPVANAKAVQLLETATHAAIADFFRAEFCLTTSTGYGSNCVAFGALLNKSTVVIMDEICHNSMFTGTFLGQPGCIKKFAHNNMTQLETFLKEVTEKFDQVIVAVEGFYSMDGDLPPLEELYRLKTEYGFTLYCDEAHSFLSIGKTGRGCLEYWNDEHPNSPLPWDLIDIRTATLSKAIGGIGGMICGKSKFENVIREHREKLIQHGNEPLGCSTMVQTLWVLGQPTLAARQIHRLERMSRFCRQELARFGIYVYGDAATPVLPVHTGRPSTAAKLSYALRRHGLLATPVTSPAVGFWESRVRVNLSAEHDNFEVDKLLEAITDAAQSVGVCDRSNIRRRGFGNEESYHSTLLEHEEASETFQAIHQLILRTAKSLDTQANKPKKSDVFQQDPTIIEAGHASRSLYGLGSGGARWICGTFPPHLAVETALANAIGMGSALTHPDSSLGIASTVAALSRPLIGFQKHYMLIAEDAPRAVEDGLLIAPKRGSPTVVRYQNLEQLQRLVVGLSAPKSSTGCWPSKKSKVYLTIYIHISDANSITSPANLASTVKSISKSKHRSAGLTLFLHTPSCIPEMRPVLDPKGSQDIQVLISGSFYHTFGLPGGYLVGEKNLIQELRYTSRGYMFTTSMQPFIMDMIRIALQKDCDEKEEYGDELKRELDSESI